MSKVTGRWLCTCCISTIGCDSSVIRAAQQDDATLSSLVTALYQGYPLPSGIAPGLKHIFFGRGCIV